MPSWIRNGSIPSGGSRLRDSPTSQGPRRPGDDRKHERPLPTVTESPLCAARRSAESLTQNRGVDAVYDALTKNLDLDALKAMLGK
jgi:hypothetical protein